MPLPDMNFARNDTSFIEILTRHCYSIPSMLERCLIVRSDCEIIRHVPEDSCIPSQGDQDVLRIISMVDEPSSRRVLAGIGAETQRAVCILA